MTDQQRRVAETLLDSYEILASHRDDLVVRLIDTLRQGLFLSRAFIRPSQIAGIANREADAFLYYFEKQDSASAAVFGEELGRLGVGDEAVLRYSRVLRHFCGKYLDPEVSDSYLEMVEDYHRTVIFRILPCSRRYDTERAGTNSLGAATVITSIHPTIGNSSRSGSCCNLHPRPNNIVGCKCGPDLQAIGPRLRCHLFG